MTVEVIIPWRAGCAHRARALNWTLDRWAATGHDVTVAAHDDDQPWCKANAVTPAARRSNAHVLVIADADVWTDGLPAAVDAITTGIARWAVPHDYVCRLDQPSTDEVLTGGQLTAGALAERPYRGHAGGGIVILPRALYLEVPLDHRFVGWGQEDDSWAIALTVLAGRPWRATNEPLWHLWHPPAARRDRYVGSDENHALLRRYKQARTAPARMRKLLEEVTAP